MYWSNLDILAAFTLAYTGLVVLAAYLIFKKLDKK